MHPKNEVVSDLVQFKFIYSWNINTELFYILKMFFYFYYISLQKTSEYVSHLHMEKKKIILPEGKQSICIHSSLISSLISPGTMFCIKWRTGSGNV